MCPTLIVGRFFRRVRSTFLFICSTTRTEVENTRNRRSSSKTERKTKPTSRTSKTYCGSPFGYLDVFHFFRDYETFFLKILDCTKGSPLHLLRYFATKWMLKNPIGSPFYITCFGTVILFSFWVFRNLFKVSNWSPLHFFLILQQTGVSKSPKGPSPLLQFQKLRAV